ncbi:MAG: 50S ribosomal protein L10 [bacterium]
MPTGVAEKGRQAAGKEPHSDKVAKVAAMRERFLKVSTAVLFDYRGLSVAQMTDLRRRSREVGVEFSVVKNNLLHRAVEGTSFESIREHLEGPVSMAVTSGDPAVPAKVLNDFVKKASVGQITGGILDGKFLDVGAIKALADLPPREALLGQVVWMMDSQVAALPRLLNALLTKLLFAFQAIANKKETG